MTQHIVKHEAEHKINIALFRHRGDVFAVAKELNVPIDYVQRLYKKLKKRRERDVSYWLASCIMQNIVEGHQQRIHYIQKYLSVLDGKEELPVSTCHHKPMMVIKKNGIDTVVCSRCKKESETITLPRGETFELFNKLIEQLREEDKSIVNFADTLGFTDKETQPAIKQNILVMGEKQVTIDSGVAREIEQLTPREMERVRKKVESQILELNTQIEKMPNK